MVSNIKVNNIQDFRQVDPNELNYMLVNAVKELKKENEAQKTIIEDLLGRVEALER